MEWVNYIQRVLLDSPLYEAPIARIFDLICITKYDQVIGRVLVCILDGVV